jgi:CheY-like chemotaxis protein
VGGVEAKTMRARRARPLVSPDAVRAWAARAGHDVDGGPLPDDVVDAYVAAVCTPPEPPRPPRVRRPGRPRILIVDDEADMRTWLRTQCEGMGWDVSDASDALSGIDRFHNVQPDVVVLDEYMPGVRGLDVARRIRAGDDEVTMLLFSASVSPAVVAEAESLSVHFISKVDHDGLVKQLQVLHAVVADG